MTDLAVISHAPSSSSKSGPVSRVTRLQQKRRDVEVQSEEEGPESDQEPTCNYHLRFTNRHAYSPPQQTSLVGQYCCPEPTSYGHTKSATKPSLAQSLQGIRVDGRLMVRLGENSPHRREHPFLLQTKANSVLPPETRVGKVAHINSGIALILAAGTTVEQLEEHGVRLAQTFGACRAERNEKWA